jgi:hypothetical protein
MTRLPRNPSELLLVFASMAWTSIAPSAGAFPVVQQPSPVVEFYDQASQRYFLTINATEVADLDAGKAGRWVRTGVTFDQYSYPAPGMACSGTCAPVHRFFAPGPKTHFFTLDSAEAESLKRADSVWNYEGIAFQASAPFANGCGSAVPVRRMYRNPDHRFVIDDAGRAALVAEGWMDEGIAMCTSRASTGPLRGFSVESAVYFGNVRTNSGCEDESTNLGPCMALGNLAPPATWVTTSATFRPVFGDKTGLDAWMAHVASPYQYTTTYIVAPMPDAEAAKLAFVQQEDKTYGIHVDTTQRGPAAYTNASPLYQFRTSVGAASGDPRVFPFKRGAFYVDQELSMSFVANVKTLNLRSATSVAYGHPSIEFIDKISGHHLHFSVLTYNSSAAWGDFVAPDAATGWVIVGTTFRDSSPYMRNAGSSTFFTPSGFVAENPWGRGGTFGFRMNRDEFARALASARAKDPALSAEPDDYFLDNYRFKNEVYGDGEIGMNITGLHLEIVARGS